MSSAQSSPPEAWPSLLRLARFAKLPLERFLQIEAASGIVLFVVAGVALAWANSPWAAGYFRLWHTPLGVRLGGLAFERPLEWYVNDGLMAVFFFVVGLEIRREVHKGELSEWRRAALPAAAALGGMVAPALIYLGIAGAPATRRGWGVPMATDIAFAMGVLALLGRRVPAALRVLLLALAVIDDLGAIIVIALFYSAGIAPSGLLAVALGLVLLGAMRAFGVRSKLLYVAPALLIWAGTYAAGVHPTIAGVVLGVLTPVQVWLGPKGFARTVRGVLDRLSRADEEAPSSHDLAGALRRVEVARREAMSPAEALIEALHPWVAFVIMPLFALANAGVSLKGASLGGGGAAVALGAAAGLVVGKPLGVLVASGLALRLGVATLPRGLTARHLVVLGVVAGIGFTMSLFIAQLAFADRATLGAVKLGVLTASALAAALGLGLGRLLLRAEERSDVAPNADQAERSTEL
jgi:NhaA family Na+:H+ antiporter